MIELQSPSRPQGEHPPAHPFQLLMRATIVIGALIATGCTRLAADEPLVEFDIAIIVLSMICTLTPDTNLGLLVVIAIGANWFTVVDDQTTPWAIGAGVGLALFHTSMSASSVSPVSARWSTQMRHRWERRLVVQVAVVLPAWVVVTVVGRVDIGASSIVMTGALLVISIAGLWGRHGTLRPDGPQRAER